MTQTDAPGAPGYFAIQRGRRKGDAGRERYLRIFVLSDEVHVKLTSGMATRFETRDDAEIALATWRQFIERDEPFPWVIEEAPAEVPEPALEVPVAAPERLLESL